MITTTTYSTAPSPFPEVQRRSSDISPHTPILCLVAVITTPFLVYIFLIALKFPWNPFHRSRSPARPSGDIRRKTEEFELVCGVKYRKEAPGKEAAGECPVCLSVFVEGEEIRQLNACKHAFHVACIDKWLYSHSNCPVCRVFVPVKRFKRASNLGGEEDFRQGLPDAADLI